VQQLVSRWSRLQALAVVALCACSAPPNGTPVFPGAAPGNALARQAPALVRFDAAAFPSTPQITNPLSPYVPGTKYIYEGSLGKAPERDVQFVSHKTKLIFGVVCVVVVDRGYVSGRLEERTEDYFAQDFYGNVWYFGEFETSYHPKSHKSSWLAGKHGARPGIIMEASPQPGDTYHQENAPPVAEDRATVLTLTASVQTPFGSFFGNVVETKEFSPLEPGVVDHKYYEPGYGLMKDDVVKGGPEVLALTGIVTGL
jgi:hypothetical protein